MPQSLSDIKYLILLHIALGLFYVAFRIVLQQPSVPSLQETLHAT